MKVLIAIAATFASGVLMAIPIGWAAAAKINPLWGIPMAIVLCAGCVTSAVLFFGPGGPK